MVSASMVLRPGARVRTRIQAIGTPMMQAQDQSASPENRKELTMNFGVSMLTCLNASSVQWTGNRRERPAPAEGGEHDADLGDEGRRT